MTLSSPDGIDRRTFLGAVVGVGTASGLCGAATSAAFVDDESTSGSWSAAVWHDCRVSFTRSGALRTTTKDGSLTGYGVSGVDVVGPVEYDFDGSRYHVPVVDGGGTLSLVAADGTETALDVGGKQPPRGTKAVLGTAAWNGHPLSVYYPGKNASKLMRVAPGGKAKRVAKPGDGVKAALGAGDLNGDGLVEFAFVDGSATVQYIVPAGKDNSRDVRSTGKSPGSNNNFGVGAPVAIDGYGVVLPAVNGSAGLGLLGDSGWAEKSLTSGSVASKSPLHACDFDGDDAVELVFVGADGTLRYLDDVGGANDVVQVTDANGDPIPVDTDRGVV